MSIGIIEDAKSSRKKINLTQLRKNFRSRREKKSGRKCPRPRDLDILPAPDASHKDISLLGINNVKSTCTLTFTFYLDLPPADDTAEYIFNREHDPSPGKICATL